MSEEQYASIKGEDKSNLKKQQQNPCGKLSSWKAILPSLLFNFLWCRFSPLNLFYLVGGPRGTPGYFITSSCVIVTKHLHNEILFCYKLLDLYCPSILQWGIYICLNIYFFIFVLNIMYVYIYLSRYPVCLPQDSMMPFKCCHN